MHTVPEVSLLLASPNAWCDARWPEGLSVTALRKKGVSKPELIIVAKAPSAFSSAVLSMRKRWGEGNGEIFSPKILHESPWLAPTAQQIRSQGKLPWPWGFSQAEKSDLA